MNKQTCILYVPTDYLDLYKAKEVWRDFLNIADVATGQQVDGDVKVGNLYYELDGTTAKVINDASYSTLTQAFIPSTIPYGTHEYTVTSIADEAFNGCTELLAVSIPSTVTYVGNKAFANCIWLDSVAWHPVRMYNTSYAYNTCPFYNDKKIRKFTFGSTVQRIPAYLCYGLENIAEIDFPA